MFQSPISRVILLSAAVCVSPAAWAQEVSDPALEEYFVANAAYNRKLYPVAIAQYESFLSKHATHPKADLARHGAGLSQYALKQYDKAMPHFAALLAKEKLDEEISRERIALLQGRCLMFTNRQDEAKNLFVAELGKLKDPAFKRAALAAICDVSFAKSQWDEVLAWVPKLLDAEPEPNQAARGLYQQGFAMFQLKQYEEAAAALAKVADLEAEAAWKTRAAYLRGESHTMLKEFDKAEQAYAAALPGMAGAEAAECRYRLAMARFFQDKHEPALADLVAYLKEAKPDPEKPVIERQIQEARLSIARCKLELNDSKGAEKDLQALAAGDDLNAAKANLWWARVHSRQNGNYDRAAEILEPATAKFPKTPVIDDLDFDLANALMNRKEPDWKKAGEVLLRIENRKQFGQMAEVLLLRSICFHKLADYTNSMRFNDAFLERFPEHESKGDMRFMKGENLFLLNRADEAAAAYADFIAKDQEHAKQMVAAFRIAQIFHGKGEWEKALASARPLLAKKPEGRLFAQLSFVVGDCLFRQEKWAESIAPLEDFVATYDIPSQAGKHRKLRAAATPNLDTALMQLVVAYERGDNTEKALHALKTITETYPWPTPQLPLALAEQGRLAFEAGDLKLARQALQRFFVEDGQNKEPFNHHAPSQRPKAAYYLAWVETSEGKHEEAARRFAEVPNSHELAADARLQQGIALVKAEKFEESAKLFPETLKLFPEHEKRERLLYYAGLSFARLEKWSDAARFFKELVEKHPDSEFADKAIYEWAWCERALTHTKQAADLYEKLLAAHPQSDLVLKVRSELADLNLDAGAQEKVIAELTETLSKVTNEKLREDIRYQLASAHFKKGDHETAAVQFEQLLADYPESKLRGSMLFLAGESRLKLSETVAACDHFTAASKIGNTPPDLAESILMRLGETQALTGEYKAAQDTYKRFLTSYKDSRWLRNAQFGLGFALEAGDNPKAAIVEYAKLLTPADVDLWTVRARFQTGECHFNMQEYDKAVAEFVTMEVHYNKYPDWQAKAVLEIGRVLLAQGKREEAEDRFKEVIRKFSKEKAAIVARQMLDKLRDS